jgi:ferrous iron transport protein B
MKTFTIGVVGNPNCGKTTLFNALTGAKQTVGNWPGVTVERKSGLYQFGDATFQVVDLPGTYSLEVVDDAVSLDERIARDYILTDEPDLIVNIVDAANLERNLYLTTQLLEVRTPMVVALNMMDVAREQKIHIDLDLLSRQLGCPVLPLTASQGEGVENFKSVVAKLVMEKPVSPVPITYVGPIEDALVELQPIVEQAAQDSGVNSRWLAIKSLEGDIGVHRFFDSSNVELRRILTKLETNLDDDMDIVMADNRYGFVNQVIQKTLRRKGTVKRSLSDRIDRVVLNRVFGIPIFLGVMYLMFMFTINLGGGFIDFFDMLVGTIMVDGLGELMSVVGLPEWVRLIVANGIGGGIQVVATFIPVIGFLYLFLSMLEDSGYMARAAFVIDRFMRTIGLPGKSFVPMLVGFGCNVPAIMATRTLEQERERKMTIAMNPFMSCGARLPVYALFAAAFFPHSGQNLVFGLYLLGILVAIMTGMILKHTLLQGEASPFIMELPRYHVPTLKGVLLRTWDRLKSFMLRAGKVIVPMVMVLNILNATGMDGSFGNEDSDKSVLSEIGRVITPAFTPMGLREENWPAAVGIFTGVLAKEAVVGTLDAIYGQMAAQEAGKTGEDLPFDFWAGISEAFATIPDGVMGVLDTVTDPLGLSIGDISSVDTAAEEQEVSAGTFGAMVSRFDGQAGAFAYLLFILLYFPCTAAIAAVYRETNARWSLFVGAWTTGVAYLFATVFYQLATFFQHPGSSLVWIGGLSMLFIFSILLMRLAGRKHDDVMNLMLVKENR